MKEVLLGGLRCSYNPGKFHQAENEIEAERNDKCMFIFLGAIFVIHVTVF